MTTITTATSTSTVAFNDLAETWSQWTRDTITYTSVSNEPPTEEQLAAQLRRQEERDRTWTEQQRRINLARQSAEELLLSCLTPEQAALYTTDRRFIVDSELGNVYEINCNGISGNVHLLDNQGRRVASCCIHPTGLPAPDVWLAQKLMLETDERSFSRIANITRHTNEARNILANIMAA